MPDKRREIKDDLRQNIAEAFGIDLSRPLVPGPGGNFMTELTITVDDPRLNGGKPTLIPSIWNGKVLEQDAAINAALASGQQFKSFPTFEAADMFAKVRTQMNDLVRGDDIRAARQQR